MHCIHVCLKVAQRGKVLDYFEGLILVCDKQNVRNKRFSSSLFLAFIHKGIFSAMACMVEQKLSLFVPSCKELLYDSGDLDFCL